LLSKGEINNRCMEVEIKKICMEKRATMVLGGEMVRGGE
jgi:hypothetical protein